VFFFSLILSDPAVYLIHACNKELFLYIFLAKRKRSVTISQTSECPDCIGVSSVPAGIQENEFLFR